MKLLPVAASNAVSTASLHRAAAAALAASVAADYTVHLSHFMICLMIVLGVCKSNLPPSNQFRLEKAHGLVLLSSRMGSTCVRQPQTRPHKCVPCLP